MIYREYGKSGIKISAISCGGMRFGDNPESAVQLIVSAYKAGINYFDTAPGYGKSEDFYGMAFQEMKKTKDEFPYYVASKTFAESADGVRRDLEKSLSRMGIAKIDFYHVWCILSLDDYRERKKNGVIREFEKIRDEGLADHICVSTHMNGDEISEMLDDQPFEGVLLGYSPMNFAYREKALEAAEKRKIAIVAMNPLGGGLIPQNPNVFSFLKNSPDDSLVQSALRFLINDRRITSSLVGFSSLDELHEALEAVNGFQPLSEERISQIRSKLAASFDKLCTSCRYCDECPSGIPVPKLMDVYNMQVLRKTENAIPERLKWHWSLSAEETLEILGRCSECGICERHCTQKLPILKRFSEIRAKLLSLKKG